MTFKKTLIAASLAALSLAAFADDAPPADAPDWALTANVGLASSYRFRGIDQTFNQPAIQGGVDLSMPYGFYIGNWNSNVNGNAAGYYGGNIEVDLYGGWKYAFNEDVGTDIGIYNYLYPGSNNANNPSANVRGQSVPYINTTAGVNSGMVENTEIYFGANWKTVSLKQYIAVTPYFNAVGMKGKSTAGSGYTNLVGTYDLGGFDDSLAGWGVLGHVGYFYMTNYSQADYADWEFGVTKDLTNGWNAKLSYIQAATQGNCGKGQFYCFGKQGISGPGAGASNATENAGHATAMLTIGRTF